MGCVSSITVYDFPKQSKYVNRRCNVCFHYDTTKMVMGTVIRDDREEPFETLIRLDDGRTIRGVECQYSFSLNVTRGDNTHMNKYEKLAEELTRRLVKNTGTVEVTPEEAMTIIQYLLEISRIQEIIENGVTSVK